MAGGIATGARNDLLDAYYGSGTPATLYAGLLLSEPEPDDTGSTVEEISGGSYARVAYTNDGTNWPGADNGMAQNGTIIQFPEATADWGVPRYIAFFSASTAGSLISWCDISNPRQINTGYAPFFDVGYLAFVVSNLSEV